MKLYCQFNLLAYQPVVHIVSQLHYLHILGQHNTLCYIVMQPGNHVNRHVFNVNVKQLTSLDFTLSSNCFNYEKEIPLISITGGKEHLRFPT